MQQIPKKICKNLMKEKFGNSPIWTLSQTTLVGNEFNVSWGSISKYEFWVYMNMFYKLYYEQAKMYKHESDPEYYASLVITCFNNKKITPSNLYLNYIA